MARRLRVLFVIPSLGSGGGAERSLIESVSGLLDQRLRVSIAQFFRRPHEEKDEDELRSRGAHVHDITAMHRPQQIAALRGIINCERPDIVHTTLFDADVVGRVAAWHAASPPPRVLTSLVNTSYDKARGRDPRVPWWKLRAVRLADSWTARHLTHHFHAITRAVKDDAVRSLGIPPDRITVIERGRDTARLGEPSLERRARSREALGLDPRAIVVVNVGRQEYQKGQIHLLRAFEQIADGYPDAVLLLAGRRGHESDAIDSEIARSHVRDRIRVLGHRDDLPEVLAASDVFAFPSIYEGLGGAAIEAMALGLPVVASDLPALHEVVENGASALLVPPADPLALATALGRLLGAEGLRQRLGARGREIFRSRFTLDRSQERMVELYKELARA